MQLYAASFRTCSQSKNRKPHVALILQRGNSADDAGLIVALNSVFRCSVHRSAPAFAPDLIGGAEMAIWQFTDVLEATVSFSTNVDPASGNKDPVTVRFIDRRVLLATHHLQVATLCLP